MSVAPDSNQVFVVGAGIGGLGAALALARQGYGVVVLEGSEEVGGLLRSTSHADKRFDLGTHFIIETQDPVVDELFIAPLLESVKVETFQRSLHEAHFFRGRLNIETGCPDLRNLDAATLDLARAELIDAVSRPKSSGVPATAAEFVAQRYGATVSREFYEPAVAKLADVHLGSVGPEILSTFHFPRLVLFGSETSRALKASGREWDDRLAYARIDDAHSSVKKFYPHKGSVGAWPGELRRRAEKLGVQFFLGAPVTEIEVHRNCVQRLYTRDGQSFRPAAIVWTVAPELALRAAGVSHRGPSPIFRDVQLFHFVASRRYLSGPFWISNYDPDFVTYRTTLYGNFDGCDEGDGFRLTVEVLTEDGAEWIATDRIEEELRLQGVVPTESSVSEVGRQIVPRALPIPVVGAKAARGRAIERAAGLASNLHLAGSGNGAGGQVGIMRDVVRVVSSQFGGN